MVGMFAIVAHTSLYGSVLPSVSLRINGKRVIFAIFVRFIQVNCIISQQIHVIRLTKRAKCSEGNTGSTLGMIWS